MKSLVPIASGIALLLIMRAIFGEDSWVVSSPVVIGTGVLALIVIILVAKRNMAKAEAETNRGGTNNG
jgi:hypothetical protein